MTTTSSTNKSLKATNIMYSVSTIIFVLFDSVGALFFNTPVAIEGIRHMGFPDYFRVELGIGKIIGGVLLIIPAIPQRFKEWAYVGFGISCISATIGHLAIGTQPTDALMPLVVLMILTVSYICNIKRVNAKQDVVVNNEATQWQHQTIPTP